MNYNEFIKHPKVKFARKLLFEAERELLENGKIVQVNKRCKCGHIRKVHAPSHNINYTGGACHKCKCMNFLSN